MFPESIFEGDPEFVQDARVTDKGMIELRACVPYGDLNGSEADRRLTAVSELFTVGLITRYIEWKLGADNGAGQNGDHPVAATPSSARGNGGVDPEA